MTIGMTIGNVSSKRKPAYSSARATGLRFSRDAIVMSLEDGREISIPLRLYPTLQTARPAQRKSFELIGDGRAFRWEELDHDLSVEGLLHGLAERIPPAPPKRGQRS
jgi:hypothetical protein